MTETARDEAGADDAVVTERHNHVEVVSINRPNARNAVNAAVAAGLGQAVSAADSNPDVRAIVITGSSEAFCAGADLKALARGESLNAPGHDEWGFAGFVQQVVQTPTIAAVNGFALGGGTEIVLACDLAVVDPSATLGLPEVRRGLIAAAGGLIRTPSQIGLKFALELALTGQSIDAQTAVRFGLANRVSAPGEVLQEAISLATMIADNAPVAVRESKQLIHAVAAGPDDDPWKLNAKAMGRVLRSADFKEGTAAFAQKRQPEWKGE